MVTGSGARAGVGRRGVLAGGGVVTTAAALEATPWGRQVLSVVTDPLGRLAADLRRAGTVRVERVRREADQLSVDVVLVDLDLVEEADRPHLVPRSGTGYLAVVLAGQSLGEEARGHSSSLPGDVGYVKAELALPTVLAFEVPEGTMIPYDVAGLLGWTGLTPLWTGGQTGDRRPSQIEAPYRLRVQPGGSLRWAHASGPREREDPTSPTGSSTELWHTVLSERPARATRAGSTARAVVRLGPNRPLAVRAKLPTALKLPLDATDRTHLVQQANTFTTSTKAGTGPVSAELLLLSPLGATLELHGSWPQAGLLSWDHRATLGRDQYVKTVTRGWLTPWGHPAAIISETWRRMSTIGAGKAPYAVLSTTWTLVLLEPTVDTSVRSVRTSGGKTAGSRLPFRSVRCTQRVSPALDTTRPVGLKDKGGIPLTLDGEQLRLPFVGTDWEGQPIPFTSVVGFAPANASGDEPTPQQVAHWNGADKEHTRDVDLGGAATAIAPVVGAPGSTRVSVGLTEVRTVHLDKQALGGLRRAPFRPVMTSLEVTVPALVTLAEQSASSGPGLVARGPGETGKIAGLVHGWPEAYAQDEANPGGVLLKVAQAPVVKTAESLTGGLGKLPDAYQGFSSKVGAVMADTEAALDKLAQGKARADQIFGNIKLLGALPLDQLVQSVEASGQAAVDKALATIPQAVTEVVDGRQTVTTRLTPTLKKYSLGPLVFLPRIGTTDGALVVVATAAAGGSEPAEHSLDARLTSCTLQLAGLVKLPVEELHVTSTTGAPFDLQLTLGTVEFLGPLGFVQELVEVLAPLLEGSRPSATRPATGSSYAGSAGTASPDAGRGLLARRGVLPDVDVDLEGIHVHQAIAIPDVAVGVFTLTGLGFGLQLDLRFVGGITVELAFASFENPFQVSYGPFGGGGYALVQLTGGDLTKLEISLMVVGGFGINLGVAAGAVTVSAGVVMTLPKGAPIELSVFFRASGALEVLGLVSVSVVFEIVLGFANTDPITFTGTATLAMKVEVLWVSKTVTASVSKTFTGGERKQPLTAAAQSPAARGVRRAGPTEQPFFFDDVYRDAGAWQAYVDAYAPA